MDFNSPIVQCIIKQCLEEDIGMGDHSSMASISKGKTGSAQLIFKENGIVAGLDLAVEIFHTVDKNLNIKLLKKDGDKVSVGEIGLYVFGSIHAILASERLVLNFLQRLSGIATMTRSLVKSLEGTSAKLLDTRKTTPGIRLLEKWAVTVGGGLNHRMGLYDMIMLKDNHVDYAGGINQAIQKTKEYLDEHKLNLKIIVETRNLEEVKETLQHAIVDRIMFDNFSPELMKQAVALVNAQKETEASGGITINNIRAYAETGVNFISIGALTHSVKSLDISLKETHTLSII